MTIISHYASKVPEVTSEHGGLALSRPIASVVVVILMMMLVLILPQRAGSHPGESQGMA
jgi:hypothetical protein